ncbi:MAG: SDR family NAD(P)-dependent oxidoreductase [Clostridia bacterium]|nr:SDR family NAD(P)-dependent oxidoreductase [Clostridia bacterium]
MSIEKWLKLNTVSLKGKTVAITGSTGGLGRELCLYLAKLGANLILVDRNLQKSQKFALNLKENYGIFVECITADLSDFSSVKTATEELKKRQIDIFIHNAGAYSIPRYTTDLGFENIFQINFVAPYYMVKELMPNLRKVKGRAVAVGSIAHNYSKADKDNIDFSNKKADSLVYGNAKRYLMFSLYNFFKNETEVSLSITHPGITFTNITAHYPKLIFAIIKHPMKIIFMKPKKAVLSILKGCFESTDYHKIIGPHILDIWGYPRTKLLKTCSEEESNYIFTKAEEIYKKL